MTAMESDDNPYRSPTADTTRQPGVELGSGEQIEATLLDRSWAFRRIRLSGRIRAVVTYNGFNAREAVFVNGVRVAHKFNIGLRLVPHFDFELHAEALRLAAAIDVRGRVSVTAFRLTIDGQVVYSEGNW